MVYFYNDFHYTTGSYGLLLLSVLKDANKQYIYKYPPPLHYAILMFTSEQSEQVLKENHILSLQISNFFQ